MPIEEVLELKATLRCVGRPTYPDA